MIEEKKVIMEFTREELETVYLALKASERTLTLFQDDEAAARCEELKEKFVNAKIVYFI